jgi:hypothetical protein
MAFTTFGASTAVATIPAVGARRSSASYTPGYAVPLTVFSGAPGYVGFSPQMAQQGATVGNSLVGSSYYQAGIGWRPGYRLPGGDAPTNYTTLYDAGQSAGYGGLVAGTMRGREGSFHTFLGNTGTAVYVPNGAFQEFNKPYQWLPVMNSVAWSATFRMTFPTATTTSGSATVNSNAESCLGWTIPMNKAGSNQTFARCMVTNYNYTGSYRQVQWQFTSDFSSATGNLASGGGIIAFQGSSYIDWTLSFTPSGGMSVTMTPSNGTAGTATMASFGASPADLALCFGGFQPSVYGTADYGIDNLTITTGLSD